MHPEVSTVSDRVLFARDTPYVTEENGVHIPDSGVSVRVTDRSERESDGRFTTFPSLDSSPLNHALA